MALRIFELASQGVRVKKIAKTLNAAHRRLKAAAATYLRGTKGQLWGRPPTGLESRYLLAGLSRCALCGSGFTAHSSAHGRKRCRYYVCAGFYNRGKTICANNLPLPMREADEVFLAQLSDYVLRQEIVDGAVQDALQALRPKDETIEKRVVRSYRLRCTPSRMKRRGSQQRSQPVASWEASYVPCVNVTVNVPTYNTN